MRCELLRAIIGGSRLTETEKGKVIVQVREAVSQILENNYCDLGQGRCRVKAVLVFGSFAGSRQPRQRSDLDLMVVTYKTLGEIEGGNVSDGVASRLTVPGLNFHVQALGYKQWNDPSAYREMGSVELGVVLEARQHHLVVFGEV